MAEDHSQHHSTGSNKALLATAGITSAVIAAPYLFPTIGKTAVTQGILNLCTDSSVLGTGLTGILNGAISKIPLIGSTLVVGGWASAAISGGIGIGGALLGNYLEKHYDRPGHIPWGKIIKYAALATSILIALPSILSGVSMGLTYLAAVVGGGLLASHISAVMSPTLGLMGSAAVAGNGTAVTGSLASLIPHLITCGGASIPIFGSLLFGKSEPEQKPEYRVTMPVLEPTRSWTARVQPSEMLPPAIAARA